MNLIKLIDASINPLIIIPDNKSIVGELFLNDFERINVNTMAKMPKAKEKQHIQIPVIPNNIAKQAPTPAPLETPKKSGDTSLF